MDNITEIKNEIVSSVKEEVMNAINAEKRSLEQALANANAPKNESGSTEFRDIASAIREKRAITLSGTGITNVVSQIVKEAAAKMPLLGKVRVFQGRDATTNIPIWSPSLAVPSNYAEGATSVGSDSTAVLGVASLTPYAYISILPVSNEALLLSGSNLEAELPSIFAEAFSKAMHAGMLTGGGTSRDMMGIFTADAIDSGNLLSCGAAGAPKVADVVNLALKLQDFHDDAMMVMNPAFYAGLMADSTSGYDVYKEELLRNKTVEGVKVVLTSYAPTDTTAGKVLVAGGNFKDYALAIASALSIEPMKKVGENLTYFQAVAYFNGKPILPTNFYGLKAVSSQ